MIKMIAGVFGLRVKKDGQKDHVIGMGPNDGPFSTDPEQEARLVRLGIAEYVNEPDQQEQAEQAVDTEMPIGFDEMPPADDGEDETEDTEAEAEVETDEVDLEALTTKGLREIGKQYGITFKANATKAVMIEAIEAAQSEVETAEDDGEDAPSFDASEAVL